MATANRQRLISLAKRSGILTSRAVVKAGIHTQALSLMVREGVLERVARGQYRLPEQQVTEHHGLAVVAGAAPHAVVCLLSALSFHDIGSQLPFEVWIAIDRRARRPTLRHPPLRVVRFSAKARTEGIEIHKIEGQSVRIYSIAKTLADVFKYRNKIGLDAALEALHDAWRHRRFSMDELDHFAKICRVHRVMRPYLEALVA